ncbi:glycoside hydrolase family 13 protein [Lentinula edodes]|uniref:Glycoside hydrolase family 13 protein n=1 Tax=Lentinula edodes TaxID=5353 RepID=A0A1Q3ECP9_LENED|nr:glycoside hydrolase family 13 protein [Lentinula edodes]
MRIRSKLSACFQQPEQNYELGRKEILQKPEEIHQQVMKLLQVISITASLTFGLTSGRTFTVFNGCPFTMWPAMFTGVGTAPDFPTGWEAAEFTSVTFTVPDNWQAGRIWGRRDCDFTTNPGPNSCLDGGCNGGLVCDPVTGTGVPPATLAEFTLSTDASIPDNYDVSLVDGYNLPLSITSNVNCPVASCPVDLGPDCPAPLIGPFDSTGFPVGCKSACDANLDGDPAAFAASADEWTKRSIYQIVTDRFALGNGSSPSCDTSEKKYCGGNWQGIISKLDYIQSMGFDAIWISPVVENIDGAMSGDKAYHGYWTQNINSLNANFGSANDLRSLSSALHDRGMYLMVDIVVNHLVANPTSDSQPQTFDYSLLQPFGGADCFHSECFISDYNNQTNVEQCWLGYSGLPLLDLDTENSTTVNIMYNWIKNLVSDYSIDGLRVDTVKHVRKDFWPEFASSAGVYTVGEVLTGEVGYAAPYTEGLDSILDYPTYFAVHKAFTNGVSGNMAAIAEIVTEAQNQIQSTVSDQSIVKNVITWPFINDGIPILYYGQEQGYQGGNDPANREALWLSGFDEENKPLLAQIRILNAARKQAISYSPFGKLYVGYFQAALTRPSHKRRQFLH